MNVYLMCRVSRNIGKPSLALNVLRSSCDSKSALMYSNDAKDYEIKCQEGMESRTVEFSRNRSRDMSGEAINLRNEGDNITSHQQSSSQDEHVEIYDSQGTLNLSSVMQSNVPEPYSTCGKKAPTHLNMPGGHVGQNQKYLSDNLQKTHSTFNSSSNKGMVGFIWHAQPAHSSKLNVLLTRNYSSFGMNLNSLSKAPVIFNKVHLSTRQEKSLTAKEKLKLAVRDYGSTVIIFHVTISLISLGGFYLAVSSGLDVVGLLQTIGLSSSRLSANSFEVGASTFVVAYAVHKIFAPLRIAMTLTASPIIVNYLRKRGFIKK